MMSFKIKADWKPTLKWLERIKRGTDDARPLWVAMIPRVREFISHEFSGSNPSRWKQLTPQYRRWKAKKGFPHWIGVLTGKLRAAANREAIIKTKKKYMEWKLNKSIPVNKRGDKYSGYFNFGTRKMPKRPIFRSTKNRINSFLKRDIINMRGGSRMSFTFAWLSKALDPYRK